MARKAAPSQEPLFRRAPVPTMPEGYYSSGPNPNLRRFVEEHARPYDPVADDYQSSDFAAELTGDRHSATYNFVGYPSKKPYEPIEAYLKHFTRPSDMVLDPFCGSGGVGLVANSLGRSSVLIDSSPLATAIAAAYCTQVSPDDARAGFDLIENQVGSMREALYGTICELCGGHAEIQSVTYSQTYRCPKCVATVPLAACTGEGLCPQCGEKISTRQQRLGVVPWASDIRCMTGCGRASRRSYFNSDIHPTDNAIYDVDRAFSEPPGFREMMNHSMMDHRGNGERWGLLWRPYHEGIRTVGDFFTARNLAAIVHIRSEVHKLNLPAEVKRVLLLSLASIVPSVSKQQRYYPGSTFPNMVMPGVLYIPPVNQEVNVYRRFLSKRQSAIRGVESVGTQLTEAPACISTQSATDLSAIPDMSVDYVFTDPPYSGRIQYGELNYLQEALLEMDTSWTSEEIIVNEFREWGLETWAARLTRAMEEVYRVLKPGRWASVCYHDSDPSSWTKLQDLMLSIGFVANDSDSVSSMQTGWLSLKMHTSANITKRDLVINFRKPGPHDQFAQLTLLGDEDPATFGEKARGILRDSLEAHPGSTADRLYDELVSRMVRRGEFERHNFEELLAQVAEPVSERVMRNLLDAETPNRFGTHETVRWYLRETAGQVDEAESRKEEAAAQRLESSMQRRLEEHPDETGVHYSDLFEQYLPVSDKPRRLLADWLPEFFFRTDEGTWRPPANQEERAQKAGLRASGTLRRIKRFANALLEGVPPAERDRPENAATAADWIRQCRRAGLYALGRALYEKGGFAFVALGDAAQLEVEEDYQVCVRRSVK